MFYKIQVVMVFILLSSTTGSSLVAQATSSDPVSYTINAPKTIKVGHQFTITTVFNIEKGWYVYAPIDMNTAQGKIPTKVTFKVPEGLKKVGGLELPDENRFFDTYRGNNVRMSQKFQVVKSTLLGKYSIKAHIVYQTCNEEICYPPVRKEIDLIINVN